MTRRVYPEGSSPAMTTRCVHPTRSDRRKDEVRLQAGLLCAPHHRTQEHGFEFAAVVSEVAVRLAEDRDDLRHLETERAVLVGERGAMTLRLVLLAFGGVRPDLDALPGERRPVAGAAHGPAHPEAALADPLHDRRALAVIIGSACHRIRRREAVRARRQQQPGNAGCEDEAAGGEEVAAVEYGDSHGSSS